MSHNLFAMLLHKFSSVGRKVARRPERKSPHGRLALELLEERTLLSVAADEQQFIYLLNRARHDPVAYQQEAHLSVDLSAVAPRPPLAVNDTLEASSQFHAQEMARFNYFGHQSQVTGDWPNKMARDQGYTLPSFFPSNNNTIESLAAGIADPASALQLLIVDSGISPPGHRIHLLGMDSFANHREIGVGLRSNATSTYRDYWAIHTAYVDTTDRFLTGVVFNDANNNGLYDAGEGIAGATVSAGGVTTPTNSAGGWATRVAGNGTYNVTVSGSTFVGTATATATVSDANVEVDFVSGQNQGTVNFTTVATVAPATFTTVPTPDALSQVAFTLTHSSEYYSRFVTGAYRQYLKRDPDAGGLANWVSALQRGFTDEQLEAAFIGSSEYIHDHGGTGEAWVMGLYRDLLGRDPDAQGLQSWLNALKQGVSPSEIAHGFAASAEREAQRITADYQKYLGRDPEPGIVPQWVDSFLRGASNENVIASFVGSQENFQKHSSKASDWLSSAYQDILGRAPDSIGYNQWLAVLSNVRQ
jgi:uncharacterized protein YkwD/predicted secreted protein